MNAALLLLALTLGQADPLRPAPATTSAASKADAEKSEEPGPFTLSDLAAGAKNDAFVDEYLKDKKLTLFGTVQSIERFAGDESVPPRYRLVMNRLGRDERNVDVEVYCYFAVGSRKDLSTLEPEVSKVTVEGKCTKAALQGAAKGFSFLLALEDCKIVPTPAFLQEPVRGPAPAIIPNVVDPAAAPPRLPAPPPPPLPMQP
ncbi:hypothetical protein [Anatilimnocola floriformis]|uniref:hypothetical protein n=1 Tax=Anatilimnocola floriformis TaxID=2948575 RepID=UPI0020C3E62B|nr:hypothetical protein [Anatilimnocola floriformis]